MDPLSLLTEAASALSGLPGGLTQSQRLLRVHTPLGDDVLFAEDIEAWEGVGPANGPALGDAEFDGGSAMAVDVDAAWAFDASLGPARATSTTSSMARCCPRSPATCWRAWPTAAR